MACNLLLQTDEGCPQELEAGPIGSVLVQGEECPEWTGGGDGGAPPAQHSPVTIGAGSNPALDIDFANQVLDLDLSASGSYDNTASGASVTTVQAALDCALNPNITRNYTLGNRIQYTPGNCTWNISANLIGVRSRDFGDFQALIPNTWNTVVGMTTIIHDDAALAGSPFFPVGFNDRLVIPMTDRWQLSASILFQRGTADNNNTFIGGRLLLNGVQFGTNMDIQSPIDNNININQVTLELTIGDVIQLQAWTDAPAHQISSIALGAVQMSNL